MNEAQVGINVAERNINNLRYADDTTLMSESKEEVKSLLMKMELESEKTGLKLNIQNTTFRTDFGTLWDKARVGCSERTAMKQVYYQG